MSEGLRGGERRRACANKAHAPAYAREIVACARQNASFARSFDPCTSILTRVGASKALRGEAFESVSRLGKPTRVGGTSTGAERTGVARLAVRHRFRKGEAWRARKGRRSRPPSREDQRVLVGLLARRVQLQTSSGGIWPRISSAYALQKGRSGSSERGPSSERRSAGQTVGKSIG